MKGVVKILCVVLGLILGAVTSLPAETVVSLVRSDYPELSKPVDPKSELSKEQIEELVREALELLGGMDTVVKPHHRWVVIKPNIVVPTERGTGDITDSYVVRAIVKLVHEAAPGIRISIAEGPGSWITPGHPPVRAWAEVIDGFQIAGYRDLLNDPELTNIDLDIIDLNFDEAVELTVPGGGNARDTYFLAKSVVECDVLIDVPVLKVTNSIGLTNVMKNMIGTAPGLKYGWSKSQGYPPGSGNPGIPHHSTVFDEMIVDFTSVAGIDLVVVDAIVGLPLSFGLGEGGEAQAPLARVVIGGLASSTLITLVLVPVVYTIFEQKLRPKKEQEKT